MSKFIEDLNPQQKAAVLHCEGPLSIIAGAGSGKTRTLTRKLAYLIENIGLKPQRILAVTFTNKAANEMKERVVNLVGDVAQKSHISTYHSLCVKILRSEIGILGYPSNFNIIDNLDQKQVLSSIYKKHNLSPRVMSYNTMIAYISKNKMNEVSVDELLENAEKDIDKIMAKVYCDYMKVLKNAKSLDFDDLIIFVYRIFKEDEGVANRWGSRYDYILVDEFQDTSTIQYEIIKSLAINKNITIVGDPDQTIYTWRYANSSLINIFAKDFSGLKTVVLEQNYRSTQTILDAANKLIKHNRNREPKKLFTEKEEGPIISFYHGSSDDAEGRWVAQMIHDLKRSGVQLKDMAILYRANYISQSMERQLIKTNINYIIYGGIKFYQRQEIKDVIAFLKIINNNDEISLIRMINTPSRKIGAIAQEKLRDFAAEKNLPLMDAIKKHFKILPISLSQRNELAKFINLISKYKIALKTHSIADVISKFVREVGYYNLFSKIEDQNRFDNIEQLINSIILWEKSNKDKTLEDYLSEIALYIDDDLGVKSNNFIPMMTIHSAKGLEFEYVFLVGFSEGVFPSKRTIDESGQLGLEEERRLAYVAITRAKNKLFVSDSRGYAIDHKTQKKPSRFIEEMGLDIRSLTSEFIAPKNFDDNYVEERSLIEGDKVNHIKFGLGVVVSVQDDIAEISFKSPHGVKTIMKNHKSIQKVGE